MHIVTANNEKINVECCGSTFIESQNNPIEIIKVLHVPGLAENLLSVCKIVENGNIVMKMFWSLANQRAE